MNKLLVKRTNDWDRRASLLFYELWCARINLVLASHLLPKFQLINAYVTKTLPFDWRKEPFSEETITPRGESSFALLRFSFYLKVKSRNRATRDISNESRSNIQKGNFKEGVLSSTKSILICCRNVGVMQK